MTACVLLAVVLAQPASAQRLPSLRPAIAEALVAPEADRVRPLRWVREPRVIALYFGAEWCGPCHAFVPELKRVRDALRCAGADTEVVYVSLDESEAQMRRYMRLQAMPWPAVDYRRAQKIPALRRLAGSAPPNLVLLDGQGNVLASAWRANRYVGLAAVIKQWHETMEVDVSATQVRKPVPEPLQRACSTAAVRSESPRRRRNGRSTA